jgi:hypothetical protein
MPGQRRGGRVDRANHPAGGEDAQIRDDGGLDGLLVSTARDCVVVRGQRDPECLSSSALPWRVSITPRLPRKGRPSRRPAASLGRHPSDPARCRHHALAWPAGSTSRPAASTRERLPSEASPARVEVRWRIQRADSGTPDGDRRRVRSPITFPLSRRRTRPASERHQEVLGLCTSSSWHRKLPAPR